MHTFHDSREDACVVQLMNMQFTIGVCVMQSLTSTVCFKLPSKFVRQPKTASFALGDVQLSACYSPLMVFLFVIVLQAPSTLLDALEAHLASLDSKKAWTK